MKLYNMDSGVLVQRKYGRKPLQEFRRLPMSKNRITRYTRTSRFDDCPALPLQDEEWTVLLNSITDDSLLEVVEVNEEDVSGADEVFAQLSRVRRV